MKARGLDRDPAVPSISLYRIPNADLSSIQAIVLSDDMAPTEIPTRDIPSRLFIYRDSPEGQSGRSTLLL